MNPMLTSLYLDAQRVEIDRRARTRHLVPASNPSIRRGRFTRRWR